MMATEMTTPMYVGCTCTCRYTSGGALDFVGDVQWGRCDASVNNALDLPDPYEVRVARCITFLRGNDATC